MTSATRVAFNTFTSYFRFVILLAVNFFLTPLIIRTAGNNEFGLWSLVLSVLNFFELFDLGFTTGIVKYVAECKGRKEIDRRNHIVSTTAVIYLALSLLAALSIGLLTFYFNRLFNVPINQQREAITLLWILACRMVLFSLPFSLFRGILFGEQRIDQVNFIETSVTIVYGITAGIALKGGAGLITIAWINLITMLIGYSLYIIFSYKFVAGLKISWALVRMSMFREMVSFSSFAFIINISVLVLLRMDPVIIKLFMPLSAVAIYAIALKIADNAHLLTKQFVNVLSPLVAEVNSVNDHQRIRFILINCTKFALVPSVIITVAVLNFGNEFINFWVGPQFLAAVPVLIILMIAMTLSVPQLTAATVLTMSDNQRFVAFAAILGTSINIVMSIILIQPLMILGVACGTLCATLLVDLLIVVSAACRKYQIPYLEYCWRTLVLAIWPGAIQFLITLAIKHFIAPKNLFSIAGLFLPGLIAYLLLFWFFSFEPIERQLVMSKILRKPVAAKNEEVLQKFPNGKEYVIKGDS